MPPNLTGVTRKSHTKSRKGCATCKRRHIRCDEERPQCGNCIKHHVSCDFLVLGQLPPSISIQTKGPNLLSTAAIERELETWRRSGAFPFPDMYLQHPEHFLRLSRIEMRLIHHLCTIYRDMRLADFAQCTFWVELIPCFLDVIRDQSFALSAVLAFSATHMAWVTRSPETIELAYQQRGAALRGLQDAIGSFSKANADAVLSASILLCWQATDWESWKFNMSGIGSVIQAMSEWMPSSRLSEFVATRKSFFNRGSAPILYDDSSVPLAIKSLQDLSSRLQHVHPLTPRVAEILAFAQDFHKSSSSLHVEKLFDKLKPLRDWLFWLPVHLVLNNDISSVAMILLAQLYSLATAIDAALPELNGGSLGDLTIPLTERIDVKLKSSAVILAPGDIHSVDIDNLMQCARLLSVKSHLQDDLASDPVYRQCHSRTGSQQFTRTSTESLSATPEYARLSLSPGLSSSSLRYSDHDPDDTSIHPLPFPHYPESLSRPMSQLLASPHLSEYSADAHSVSGFSQRGESPAYSPAANSPLFLPDMPDEDWAFPNDSPEGSQRNSIFLDNFAVDPNKIWKP